MELKCELWNRLGIISVTFFKLRFNVLFFIFKRIELVNIFL